MFYGEEGAREDGSMCIFIIDNGDEERKGSVIYEGNILSYYLRYEVGTMTRIRSAAKMPIIVMLTRKLNRFNWYPI